MFTPEPPLKFPPADQAIADRLMKIVPEIDRLEGYSQPHAMAVARLAESLAHQLDLRGHDLTALLLAALAHDLGERTMKRNYLLREDALSWEEKFALDVWYVDHRSFGLDLRILLRTLGKVVAREGIAAAGDATMPEFNPTHDRRPD